MSIFFPFFLGGSLPLRFFLVCVAGLFLVAAKPPPEAIQARCAHEQSNKAQSSKNNTQKRQHALKGIACASACLNGDPTQPECYYYRGVSRGFLLETRTGQYKKEIVLMIQDFKQAALLAPQLDNGGGLRALGYIYLKLPELPILGVSLSRDLEQAMSFADQALAVSPEHPDNLKLKGEINLAFKNYQAALALFEQAKKKVDAAPLSQDEKNQLKADLKKLVERAERKLKKRF